MAIRGTIVSISGKRVRVRPDGGDADLDFQGPAKQPLKVLRLKKEPRTTDRGDKVPDYEPAHAGDLIKGTPVRLMGPPSAELHTVVITESHKDSAQRKNALAAGAPAAATAKFAMPGTKPAAAAAPKK